MSAPLVGKRVTVQGLASKPQHNGALGTVLSFDDTKSRYQVRLDSGETLSLKPQNLQGGSGNPEGGTMPNFSNIFGGGGMPQGMPDIPPLPTGLALHIILGSVFASKILLGATTISMLLLGGVQYCIWVVGKDAYAAAGGGTAGVKAGCARLVSVVRQNVETTFGVGCSDTQATAALALAVLLLVYYVLPVGTSGAAEAAGLGFDPYQQGYEDALAGLPRKYADGAWTHCSSSGAFNANGPADSGGGGGFSFSKLMYAGILGQRLYQLGGGPNWSPQNVVEGLRAQHAMATWW